MQRTQQHAQAAFEGDGRIINIVKRLGGGDEELNLVWDLLRQIGEHRVREGMFRAAHAAELVYGHETAHNVRARVGEELVDE